MELVWGLKRVFKREVWNRCEHSEEAEEMEDERPSVLVVRGKDATRGAYQLPVTTRVRKKVLAKGRKLNEGRYWKTLPVSNLDALVGMEKEGGDGPQRKSTWIPKNMGQRLKLLDLAAARKRKHPVADEGDDMCQLCGKEATAEQTGARLCRNCNNSAPDAAQGRELEGFLLASWRLSKVGAEAWMRAMMLNKARWRRWRRALRTEERSGEWSHGGGECSRHALERRSGWL